jgi:hypothetical protein
MRYYKDMSKADKLLEQMRHNPRDWRIEAVPAHKPIKPAYIRQFVALIDKVKELQR